MVEIEVKVNGTKKMFLLILKNEVHVRTVRRQKIWYAKKIQTPNPQIEFGKIRLKINLESRTNYNVYG
jgi:hypothetical protein